jgi:3'-phosphoadenosine 5'-phosphosulfate sulfotransferase (PAPS reductase)/FAD synthetase
MTTANISFDTVHVDELRLLEAEAVHIIREVVAELERPVLLFSAGKDSIVLLRLAEKAFRPSPLPFPVMHVDTGHNFPEVIEFRDRRVTGHGHKLTVASVQESIDSGRVPDPGPGTSRNRQQTLHTQRHPLAPFVVGSRLPMDCHRAARRDDLVHRVARVGQVDDRGGGGARTRRVRSGRLSSRR